MANNRTSRTGAEGGANSGGANDRLRVGQSLTLLARGLGQGAGVDATIERISPGEIRLNLAQPCSRPPFRQGERVRLKHWDDQGLYYSDSEIVAIGGGGNQRVVVLTPRATISLQRRASARYQRRIPLTFVVAGVAWSGPDPERMLETQTCDVATGGLSFQTDLPLMEGDDLRLKLQPCDADPIRMAAQVAAWHRSNRGGTYAVGVQFVRMGQREAQGLARLLEGYPPRRIRGSVRKRKKAEAAKRSAQATAGKNRPYKK